MNKKVATIGCLSLALLMGGTTFTSCSSDDEPSQNGNNQEENAPSTSYDFEKWTTISDETTSKTFENPTGWDSSNEGAAFIQAFPTLGVNSFVVVKDAQGHTGTAAKIQTIDSKGMAPLFAGLPSIPKVTTGSLFLGKFITDASNTLNSTKFGIPYEYQDKYPIQLKGWYKYQAGTDYYTCDAPYADNNYKTTLDPSQKDKGTIAVVLYETPAYDTDKWTDCLTGVAGDNNISTSSRIAAIGSMNVEDQSDWKEFSIDLTYKEGKSFDPTKKYRIVISCSSSYQGDKFWGAPGSTLWVDDFELIYKNVK